MGEGWGGGEKWGGGEIMQSPSPTPLPPGEGNRVINMGEPVKRLRRLVGAPSLALLLALAGAVAVTGPFADGPALLRGGARGAVFAALYLVALVATEHRYLRHVYARVRDGLAWQPDGPD